MLPRGNRQAGASLLLVDLDTPDADGGPTVVFGRATSSDSNSTDTFNQSGLLIGGHHYELSVTATSTRELLTSDVPVNDPTEYFGTGDVTATLVVPEPPACLLWLPAGMLILRRRPLWW